MPEEKTNEQQTLNVPVPEAALTPGEEKKLEAKATQAEETSLYKELEPRISKIANMTKKEKEQALSYLKILCKDYTAENIKISNDLYRGKVLAKAMVSAYEKKDPKIIKKAVTIAKLKDENGTATVLMQMVEQNKNTRKMLESLGIHLTKRRIAKQKKVKVTSAQLHSLSQLFDPDELNSLFEAKK